MKQILFCSFMLIAASANAKTVYTATDWVTDNVFTQGIEGPAVDHRGILYAVNFEVNGTIGKVTGKNAVEKLISFKSGSIGNGIRFDKSGNMFIADYVNHNVLKIPQSAFNKGNNIEGSVITYAHNNQMNQPNDLAIMDNGVLFASDPNWQNSTGNLWRIDTHGNSELLESNMGTTNGIEVSPDNKTLYVNESVQRKVWRYDLDKHGNISNKQLHIAFSNYGLDGMRTDKQGNLYIARYGAGSVAIVSPNGTLIREVKLKGKHPTNVAFGGDDGKTVYVTMQQRGAIEVFQSEFAGRSFQFFKKK